VKYRARRRFGKTVMEWVQYIVCAVILAVFFGGLVWCNASGCEGDRNEAKRIVENAGYTAVEVGGSKGYKCGRDDGKSNTFSALAPNGSYVEGTVCCSLSGCAKGCTLRFE
jgi:hypothetical protein